MKGVRKLLKEVRVVIRGEHWMIQFTTRKQMPRGTWGDCDRKNRVIRVRHDLSSVNFLDTLIHEIRHAQHPVLFEAEEFVTDTSSEIAMVVIQTGRVAIKRAA